ncbi:DUF4124 domain-containing protein [Halioxenophilus sp. WMMB6]|uniref:DUF4124 domain-containing protein n=1 Tax=Halioxenophilus sp. WMMB6 TaxID=3073815 RepID=UPI00295E336B|nr:DUF4124 domain-containing protein [Halioxenophilus sp. WMMB6]
MRRSIAIATGLLAAALVTQAQAGPVYQCKNEAGKTVFQDMPCDGGLPPEGFADAKLSSDSLQGSWLITQVGGLSADEMGVGEDVWEFNGNQWTVISSGHRLSPDPFTVEGDVIDLGYSKIRVLEFTGYSMKVNTSGLVQTLEKRH